PPAPPHTVAACRRVATRARWPARLPRPLRQQTGRARMADWPTGLSMGECRVETRLWARGLRGCLGCGARDRRRAAPALPSRPRVAVDLPNTTPPRATPH